jgi:hypothetical protein
MASALGAAGCLGAAVAHMTGDHFGPCVIIPTSTGCHPRDVNGVSHYRTECLIQHHELQVCDGVCLGARV